MRFKKTLLLGLCLLLALASTAVAANTGGVYSTGARKGIRVRDPGIQLTTNAADPTDAGLASGRLSVKDNVLRFYNGTSWGVLSTTSQTADTVYNAGAWEVTVDAGSVGFDLAALSKAVKIYANITGTQVAMLVLDAEHTTSAVTDGISLTTTGASATMTDGVDASDAGITNALNAGANIILLTTGSLTGGLAGIDFTEFDVAKGTGSITIDDGGNAGQVSIEGTVLDIDTLTFVGAGGILSAASSAVTIDAAGGDAAGEDIILDGHNIQLTATGAMDLTPDGAVTLAIDLTDTNYTNAISVGTNAIVGTTGVIDYSNFDVAADGDVDCVDLDASGNVAITGDLTVTGSSNIETGTWNTDAVTAVTGDGDLTLNGDGTGGVSIGATSTGDVAVGDNLTVSGNTTGTLDLIINGGDFTMTSAVASKPNLLFTNSVVGTTGSVTTYDHTRGGVASVNGDDIHTDTYNGYDAGPASDTFVSVLYEITDITAGTEDGNVTWSVVSAGNDLNFLELDGVAGVQINSGAVDVDTTIGTNDAAALVVVDAMTNDVTMTRALTADGTNDGPVLVVSNTSATGDVGVFSVSNAAAASATAATAVFTSSATGFDQSTISVVHSGTAGGSGLAAVRIDTDDVDTAALYITSPVDATGSTQELDHYALCVVTEGVGGGIMAYRNVSAATEAVMTLEDDHVDSTSPMLVITTDQDASADDSQVQIISTSTAFDTRLVFIDNASTAGATTVPTMEIDTETTTAAALVIRSAVTGTGTSPIYDDHALVVQAEGVGGAAQFYRVADDPTHPLVKIEDALAAVTTSNSNTLLVTCAGDGSVSDSVVELTATDAAHDQAVLQVTQAGTATNILVDGVTPLVTIGDADEEDAQINFDGNELDMHIGLDDNSNSLVLGEGTALGTTAALTIDGDQRVIVNVALNVPYETVATTNTITEFEGGKMFFLSHATEFVTTLPDAASSAGMKIRIVIANAPEEDDYTVVTEGSENVIIGGINELDVDTGDDGPYIGNGDLITFVKAVCVIGDWIELVCDGNNWYLTGQTNADGGIVLGST